VDKGYDIVKKTTVLLLLILFCVGCNTHRRSMKLASKAFEFYGNNEKLKSAQTFDQLILKYPNSEYYGKNLFNAASIYQEIDSSDLALDHYHSILKAPLNDMDKDSSRAFWETRTNYKYFSAINIGNIKLEQGAYREALNYFNKAAYTYNYYSDSSKSMKSKAVNLAIKRSKAFVGLHELDSAFLMVLPHALTKSPWNIDHARTYTFDLIQQHFQPGVMLSQMETGFSNFHQLDRFVEVFWKQHKVIVMPYKTAIKDMDEIYFLKTGIYVDVFRLVYHDEH